MPHGSTTERRGVAKIRPRRYLIVMHTTNSSQQNQPTPSCPLRISVNGSSIERTPCMAAELADYLWTVEKLLRFPTHQKLPKTTSHRPVVLPLARLFGLFY